MAAKREQLLSLTKVSQFVLVFGVTVLSVIIAYRFGLRSLWNFIWFLGVPLAIAIASNAGLHDRFRMAIWLCAFAYFTIMVTGFFIST